MTELTQPSSYNVDSVSGSAVVVMGPGASVVIQRTQSAIELARQEEAQERVTLGETMVNYMTVLSAKARGSSVTAFTDQDKRWQAYKSLSAYTIEDAGHFFGRDGEINNVISLLAYRTLSVLHGESGVGKSSLIQAGLVPQLVALENSVVPIIITVRRSSLSHDIMNAVLPGVELRAPRLYKMPLSSFLHELQGVVGLETQIVVILDQFENFFSQLPSEVEAKNEITQLIDCINDPSLNLRFLISVRDDKLAKLSILETSSVKPYANHYHLQPFTLAQAVEVASRCAEHAAVEYEPGLLNAVLHDFQAESISPADLQIVFFTLANQIAGPETRVITGSEYTKLGGISGILDHYMRTVITRLPLPKQLVAQNIMVELVGSDGTREVRSFSELEGRLAGTGGDQSQLADVLKFLLINRIVTQIEVPEYESEDRFELAHDLIAQKIEMSEAVIARKLVTELVQRRLLDHGRGALLTSTELRLIQDNQIQYGEIRLEPDEASLVTQSRRRQNRDRIVRSIALAGAALLVILVMITIAEARSRVAQAEIDAAATAVVVRAEAASEVATSTSVISELAGVQSTLEADIATAQAASSLALATKTAAEYEALQNSILAARQSRTRTIELAAEPVASALVRDTLWILFGDNGGLGVYGTDGSVIENIALPGEPRSLLYFDGRVWVAANDFLIVLDAGTRSIVDIQEISGRAGDLALVGESLWISNEEGVTQWGPDSGAVVERIRLENGADRLIYDGQYLWASSYTGSSITLIDPVNYELVREIPLQRQVLGLYYDGTSVWVTFKGGRTLEGYRPDTMELSARYPLEFDPSGMAVVSGSLWLCDQVGNGVIELDTATGRLIARYRVGRAPVEILYDEQKLWVFNAEDETATIIPLQFPLPLAPARLQAYEGLIWIIDQNSPVLLAVDGDTGMIIHHYAMPDIPKDIEAFGDGLWLRFESDIVKIDPSSGAILATFSAKGVDNFLINDAGLWLVNRSAGSLTRISLEPESLRTSYELTNEPVILLDTGDTILVVTERMISALDNDTGQLVPIAALSGRLTEAVVDTRSRMVWIGSVGGTRLVQGISLDRGEVVIEVPLSHTPSTLAVDDKYVWVSGGELLSRIDMTSAGTVREFVLGRGISDIELLEDRMWVASYTDKTIEAISR